VIDLDTHVALVEDRPVALTEKEYGIIELLSLRKGTILTKEMFLDHLYGGMDEPELKIIDVFVCKLRKKIAEATGGLITSRRCGAAAMSFATRRRRGLPVLQLSMKISLSAFGPFSPGPARCAKSECSAGCASC
jgi:DNA-binding winged helix-turn-helix (wHTH) protein